MNSPQRNEKLGRLEEMKQRAMVLSVEIHALQQEVNRGTDPTRPLTEVNLLELSAQMASLGEKLQIFRELCGEIKLLADDLGLPMPATDVRRRGKG